MSQGLTAVDVSVRTLDTPLFVLEVQQQVSEHAELVAMVRLSERGEVLVLVQG